MRWRMRNRPGVDRRAGAAFASAFLARTKPEAQRSQRSSMEGVVRRWPRAGRSPGRIGTQMNADEHR